MELESKKPAKTANTEVADFVLRGRTAYYSAVSSTEAYGLQLATARANFKAALAQAPENVDALAGSVLIELVETSIFRHANTHDRLQVAEAIINTAIEREPKHAVARYARAYLFSMTNRLEIAREEALLAISLDPSLMEAFQRLAMIEIFSGFPQKALQWLDASQITNPLDPNAIFREVTRASALLLLGRDEPAAKICQRAIGLGHRPPYVYACLISALAHLGRLDEARAIEVELRRQHPKLASVAAIRRDTRSQNPKYLKLRERLFDGLRKAGMPSE